MAAGIKEDNKKLAKHKGDIFRLTVTLVETDSFDLPETIKADLHDFANAIDGDLPGDEVFKEMGFSTINTEKIFNQLIAVA